MSSTENKMWQRTEVSENYSFYTVGPKTKPQLRLVSISGEDDQLSAVAVENRLKDFYSNSPVGCLLAPDGKNVLALLPIANDKLTTLPAGCYSFRSNQFENEKLEPMTLRSDLFWAECSQAISEVKNDLRLFLDNEDLYRSLGRAYRRSYLLYGPPGNGKTSLIRDLIKNDIKDAYVIWIDRGLPSTAMMSALQKQAEGKLLVYIFEDINRLLKESHTALTSSLLRLLDGEDSPDRNVVIATTNNPEELEKALTNRPGRFDHILMVGDPDERARGALLKRLLRDGLKDSMIKETQGLSISAIQEVCLRHLIAKVSFTEAVNELKSRFESVNRDFRSGVKLGIR